MWQQSVVALIVLVCTVHVLLSLVPSSWRRQLARWLANRPVPAALRQRCLAWVEPGRRCGCNDCPASGAAPAAPAAQQPVRFHPRGPRP